MAYSGNYGNYGGYAGEYTTTSYGPQGGNEGGGFTPGTQMNGSQGVQDKYGKDTLRPVTILQIQTAKGTTSENFTIDGAEIGHVSIVGQIRAATKDSMGINYTLDDGTGSISGRKFVNTDNANTDEEGNPIPEPPSEAALTTGSWAKAFGKPRQFGNNPNITFNFHGIKPITDKNEISHHLLEATYLHLFYTRGPAGGASGGHGKQDDGLFVQQGSGGEISDVGPVANRVYAWMQKQAYSNEGHHAQTISSELAIPFGEVMAAGEELRSVGRIFETVDSQTWKLLEQ